MALQTRGAADPERFDRRQKRLLVVAWAATLLPLFAFAYLTWQSVALKGQVDSAKASVAEARTELEKLDQTRLS